MLAVWPAVAIAERSGTAWGTATIGAVAVVLLVGGLALRLPAGVTTALVLIGGSYGVALAVENEPLDRAAPAFAAALLLCAELAWWSLELRERIAGEAGSQLRRLAFELMLAVGALALGGVLLAAVDVVRVEGLLVIALGAAAAAAALAVVLPRRA